MRFDLIDSVLEQSDEHIVAIKQVSLAEEYLADHFPTFPVLPGVMMVELMVQAARRMLAPRGDARLVLGEVKAMKFARLVRPGEALEMEVRLGKTNEDEYVCRATGTVRRHGQERDAAETAVAGRFTMRPIRRPPAASGQGVQ
ncbi:MAG: hotdog family protein [Planctomycetota bacterium]|jgi:3-hydroxyacyl-[acyl-carrier-protein] dehydratase